MESKEAEGGRGVTWSKGEWIFQIANFVDYKMY